ncbi:unnamed protein product (macronuclear) [Paramecium tetraurelia]|uniref:Transmembrane protein n=1 Tax=Paramecium tetraurelia TaxID=5888 RepID=A0E2X0_PARTE|nr:uncharacterized protein GSPATT00022809001 [Paramecium tetraurelia]CAK89637.1 unnamed protein product [Paramecium tetraurelia]|eukprot:XP_001457034.1 hypothetical protein (macronuclear) [Paramecium tetraurelia strain d4-2]
MYQNDEQVLDSFSQFGIILGSNITYESATDQPCYIINQKLKNKQSEEIVLVPQFKEDVFSNFYNDGQLNGDINFIVQIVQISTGAIVLTNQGELIYLKLVENRFKLVESKMLSINKEQYLKPVYMQYIQKSNELLIILNGETLKLKMEFESESVFGEVLKIYDVFLTEQIKSVAFIEDLLFVASGEQGLHVYLVSKRVFEQIQCTIEFRNITDLRVFQENSVYFIFALDYETGVKVITFNAKTSLFYENKKLTNIPFRGEIIDLYQDVLMVVEEQENESIIHELQISYANSTWKLVHEHQAQKYIQDIEMTENYAIIIGRNGHEIIYHSLPSYDIKIQDKIIIPGLQKLFFLNQTESNNIQMFGVTRHKFFTTRLQLFPQFISCFYSNEEDEIRFTYHQNSTKCPGSSQSRLCHFKQNYTIQFVHPVLTSEQSIYVYITCLGIIAIFVMVLGLLIKEFKRYQYFVRLHNSKDVYHQQSGSQAQPTHDIYALNSFDSPLKVNKHIYVPSIPVQNDQKIE